MKYWIAFLAVTLSLIGTYAYAHEIGPGPGTAEVTVIPGGGMFFVSSNTESNFVQSHQPADWRRFHQVRK